MCACGAMSPAGAGAARVRMLLAAGVDPNTADYDRRTGLHLAACGGNVGVVRELLAAGVILWPGRARCRCHETQSCSSKSRAQCGRGFVHNRVCACVRRVGRCWPLYCRAVVVVVVVREPAATKGSRTVVKLFVA